MIEILEADLARVTKAMSLILRHNSGNKVTIGPSGYVNVDELTRVLSEMKRFPEGFDAAWVHAAVNDPGKKRFGFSADGSHIRALSGHSFEVDLGLASYVPQGPLYFGTVAEARDRIETHGFTTSTKLKVRLLEDHDAALAVAYARDGEPIIVTVDAIRLHTDGWKFGMSESGEVLTDHFPAKYCTIEELDRSIKP